MSADGMIQCDSWDSSLECMLLFEEPPEFIRPPPPIFCDSSFDEQFSCANDFPFPFRINTDAGSGSDPTLAVAVVCAAIFSVLLTVSAVCIWRNKKTVRKYLTCGNRSPSSTRKNSPSVALSSDDSDGSATAYSDNLDYKKAALLHTISAPSGVKFLTETGIRYAPNQQQLRLPIVQPHLTLDGHIYEEIPNNYPVCLTASSAGCHAVPSSVHPARYHDGPASFALAAAAAQQAAFIQRQSWLDLLQRPPCQETTFNLYDDDDETKVAACPNCYYPSLPRDTARGIDRDATGHITVNPVEQLAAARAGRLFTQTGKKRYPKTTPYSYNGFLPANDGVCEMNYGSLRHGSEFPIVQNNLRGTAERSRTRHGSDSNGHRRRQPRRSKHTNRQDTLEASQFGDICIQRNELQESRVMDDIGSTPLYQEVVEIMYDFWIAAAFLSVPYILFESTDGVRQNPEEDPAKVKCKPVQLAVYYETLCPDSVDFVLNQLRPAIHEIGDIFEVDLVPFGKATEHQFGNAYVFRCHHGSRECKGNLIQTCAIHHLQNKTVLVDLVSCMLGIRDPFAGGLACAKLLKVDFNPVMACVGNRLGNHLQHVMAQRTLSLKPKLTWVPWIVVNGVHTPEMQQQGSFDLAGLLCSTYTGVIPASCRRSG